jgi:hypothetical protein
MKKLAAIFVIISISTPVRAQPADVPYSYEDIGKIIAALCQKAAFGYRAEVETTCPLILKRLEPQITEEKKKAAAEKKEDKQ